MKTMKKYTRWMSLRTFRLALSEYPGPKWALTRMTEEDLSNLANQGFVLATRIYNGEREYLLNLGWTL
jgi:hypothetical protein